MTTIQSNGSLYDNDSYFDTLVLPTTDSLSRISHLVSTSDDWQFEIDGTRYLVEPKDREEFWETLLFSINDGEVSCVYENVRNRISTFSFYIEILFRQEELTDFDTSLFIRNVVYLTQAHLRREIPRSFNSENLKCIVFESDLQDTCEHEVQVSRYVLEIKVPLLSLELKKTRDLIDLINAEISLKKLWRQLVPLPYSTSDEGPESISWRPFECKARISQKDNKYPLWPTAQDEQWPQCRNWSIVSMLTSDAMEDEELYATLVHGQESLLEQFPLKFHEDVRNDNVIFSSFFDVNNSIFLPFICSSYYHLVLDKKKYKKSYHIYDDEVTFFQEEDKVVDMLLDMIPTERFKERTFLLVIGKSLFNVYNGSDEGLSCLKERIPADLLSTLDPRRKWIEWKIHRS